MVTLEKLQAHIFGMLKDLTAICNNHSIDYYLAGGTLLGAVRHKGFIPWDDVVDINLKIDDIKKLKKYCQKELPDYYFWQDIWTDRKYLFIWPRLRDYRTTIGRVTGEGVPHQEKGLFIDIIPLLYTARNETLLKTQVKIIYLWSYCVRNQREFMIVKYSSVLNAIYCLLREFIVYRAGGYICYQLMQLLQDKNSQKLIVLDVLFFDNFSEENFEKIKKIMVRDEWLSPTEYQFEDMLFKSFSDYDAYLIDHYGKDYMIPRKGRTHIVCETTEIPD